MIHVKDVDVFASIPQGERNKCELSLYSVLIHSLKSVQFRSWFDDRAFSLSIYHDRESLILGAVQGRRCAFGGPFSHGQIAEALRE